MNDVLHPSCSSEGWRNTISPSQILVHMPRMSRKAWGKPQTFSWLEQVFHQNRHFCVSSNEVNCLQHLPVQGIMGVMPVEHYLPIIFISAKKDKNYITSKVTWCLLSTKQERQAELTTSGKINSFYFRHKNTTVNLF